MDPGYEEGNFGRRGDDDDVEWRRVGFYVIQEIRAIRATLEKLEGSVDDKLGSMGENVSQMRSRVDKLEVKAGAWGVLGGALTLVLGFAVYLIQRAIGGG